MASPIVTGFCSWDWSAGELKQAIKSEHPNPTLYPNGDGLYRCESPIARLGAGLEVYLITDSGKTEFHGHRTRTCVAIGPDAADKIDEITGQLQLL